MLRGLDGRRIALFASTDGASRPRADMVVRALETAGALVQRLALSDSEDDWHGAKYAGLVLIDDETPSLDGNPRLIQLVREFLVSDKPLAAFGGAVSVVFEAGGVEGRTVAARGALKMAMERAGATCVDAPIHVDEALITAREGADIQSFAARLVRELSSRLEERAVDEMSELSFPASDPPAVSPSSVGHGAPDRKPEPRP